MPEGLSVAFYILLMAVGGIALLIFFFCPFVGMIVMANDRSEASGKAQLNEDCHTYYPVYFKKTKPVLITYLIAALCVIFPAVVYAIFRSVIPTVVLALIGGGVTVFVGTRSFESGLESISVDRTGLTESYKNGDKKFYKLSEFKSYQTQGQNRSAHVDFVDSDNKKTEVYLSSLSNTNKQMVINDLLSLQSKGHF